MRDLMNNETKLKGGKMYQKIHKARQDHLCNGCTKIIEKGTQYYQVGLIPKNRNYHIECLPKTDPTPVKETKVEFALVIEPKLDPSIDSITIIKTHEYDKPNRPRDAKGRFIKEVIK